MKGIGPEEKSILNKARAILACVRYGEHYGSITKITEPKILVEMLKIRIISKTSFGDSKAV